MSDYKYIPVFSVKIQLLQHQVFFLLNLYINKNVFFNTRIIQGIFHV